MNIPSTKVVPPEAPATPADPVHLNASALVRANFKSAPADTQPCNWNLTPGEGDQITAVNTVSGSTFEGTTKEFSAALRGL